MTTLSVVIPALNEERGIQAVVERVLATRSDLRQAGFDELELIVVDDGSTDRTPAIVSGIPGARLIRHQVNGGYGAALKTGFAAACGEWVGFLDADGTYPPEYFPALCRAALSQEADIVIGSRMAGAQTEMPAVRRLGNVLFANLVSLVSAQRITDSASGMRIFRKCILDRIYPLPDGLNLTPVMSTRALHEQLKMIEVPIPYSERQGRSKLSVVRDGMRFAQSIVWTALNYNPVQLLGTIGVACLGLAALIAVGLIATRLMGSTTVSPWGAAALFAALVLAMMGVSILALGVSFTYFVALFHKQPIRQGLFGHPLARLRLDRYFGWAGLGSLVCGMAAGIAAVILTINGLATSRLWFYYLASASFLVVGVQLVIAWVQMQVLDALHARDELVAGDLRGNGRVALPDAGLPVTVPGLSRRDTIA